jgi:hypothetical protein
MSRNCTVNHRYQEQRDNDPDGLTAEERKFVDHYIISRNAADAYFQSFRCKLATAKQKGSALLRKPHIAVVVGRIVVAVSQEAAKMAVLAAHGVLEEYTKLAQADPRELVEVVVRSCRYCHGKDHKYQYTKGELDQARLAWSLKVSKKLRKTDDPVPQFDALSASGRAPLRSRCTRPRASPPRLPGCTPAPSGHVRVSRSRCTTPWAHWTRWGSIMGCGSPTLARGRKRPMTARVVSVRLWRPWTV